MSRSWVLLLLMLKVTRAEAAGEAWYYYAWEFASVETSMLMVMIPIAIVFDACWHFVTHWVERNTFLFGGKAAKRHYEHKQLFLVLLHRMGEEFMSLGFLALLVFICEREGIFAKLTQLSDQCQGKKKQCIHLPHTALDWFHMAEIVHFSLFSGMCLYYLMMIFFVSGSVRDIRMWERIRQSEVSLIRTNSSIPRPVSEPNTLGNLPMNSQYQMMQDRFIKGVMSWEFSDGAVAQANFAKLLNHLRIDQGDEDYRDHIDDRLRSEAFDFSAFLALCVEASVDDAIEFHISSWVIVWLFLAVSFPFNLWVHVTFSAVTLTGVLLPTMIWLTLCLVVFYNKQKRMARSSDKRWHRQSLGNVDSDSENDEMTGDQVLQRRDSFHNPSLIDRWFFSGHHFVRFAQVAGFVVSYVVARQIFEPPEWADSFYVALASTISLGIVYVILSLWFFHHGPLFLALMSLPPHFDKLSQKKMWALLAGARLGDARDSDDSDSDLSPPSTARSAAAS